MSVFSNCLFVKGVNWSRALFTVDVFSTHNWWLQSLYAWGTNVTVLELTVDWWGCPSLLSRGKVVQSGIWFWSMILRVCWRTKQTFHFVLKIGSEFRLVWCLILWLTSVISMQFSAQFLSNIEFQTKLFLEWRHYSCASWQPSWVIIPVGHVACNHVCWCNWWFPQFLMSPQVWMCGKDVYRLPYSCMFVFSNCMFFPTVCFFQLYSLIAHKLWKPVDEHPVIHCVFSLSGILFLV